MRAGVVSRSCLYLRRRLPTGEGHETQPLVCDLVWSPLLEPHCRVQGIYARQESLWLAW